MTADAEVTWEAIEDSIFTWVSQGSGLPVSKVVWGYFKAPRPAAPLVEMTIVEIDSVGDDWVDYRDAPDPEPGADLAVVYRGHRTFQLKLKAFGDTDAGDTSWPILSAVRSALPRFETAIDEAGAGIGEIGAIRAVPGSKGGVLEPRAEWEITMHAGSLTESRTTFIERLELTVHVQGLPDADVVVTRS